MIETLFKIAVVILMAVFCFAAISLNRPHPQAIETLEKPDIFIIGQMKEVTFYNKTVFFIDYLIDGEPHTVTLYDELDIKPFLDKLETIGTVHYLRKE